jgi:Icc-related predicted phosphoesterase
MTIKYFRLVSDIHLEFGGWDLPRLDTDHETVLIVAGDLHTGERGVEWLKRASGHFPAIIYVLGNHEYYGESFELLAPKIQAELADEVMVFARPGTITFAGIRFICATLWSDMHGNDSRTKAIASQGITDFGKIRKQHYQTKFTVHDCCAEFMIAKNFIKAELAKPHAGKTVVITHFLPSFKSVHPQFLNASDHHMNGYFASDLDDVILAGKPDFWVHGHTHSSCDYMLGETEVICNPRGYFPFQLNSAFLPDLRVELDDGV